jgi:hypothetical protein
LSNFAKGSDIVVYGAINEKGEKYYTYLKKVFDAIDNKQKDYNWLINNLKNMSIELEQVFYAFYTNKKLFVIKREDLL